MPLSQSHDRQSLSPAGLTHWYRLCAARVCRGDCHERAPWYAAHLPLSASFSPATAAPRGCQGHPRARVASRMVCPGFPSASRPMELLGTKPFSLTYWLSSQTVYEPDIHHAPAWLKWWKVALCGMFPFQAVFLSW